MGRVTTLAGLIASLAPAVARAQVVELPPTRVSAEPAPSGGASLDPFEGAATVMAMSPGGPGRLWVGDPFTLHAGMPPRRGTELCQTPCRFYVRPGSYRILYALDRDRAVVHDTLIGSDGMDLWAPRAPGVSVAGGGLLLAAAAVSIAAGLITAAANTSLGPSCSGSCASDRQAKFDTGIWIAASGAASIVVGAYFFTRRHVREHPRRAVPTVSFGLTGARVEF